MSTNENKAIARRFVEEVWGKGDFAAESALLADDFVTHNSPPGVPANREGHHQVLVMFHNAFPDMQLRVEDLIAEGDKTVDRWTMTGTHQGEFFGIPPTGKQVTVTGMEILRIETGKIQEYWGEADMMGMMQQLGVSSQAG